MTGAAGQIGYSLIYMVASGSVFGENQPIILQLLDIPPAMGVLAGLGMELDDCAFPLVQEVIATDDPLVAFKDADAAFMVGAFPRKEGMERKDLLTRNIDIFKVQGGAMDQVSKKSIKVLVVGNPANTNAAICSHYAPSIPKENFSAMTRLDHNRATFQLASKCGVEVKKVKNVIIWGNHSSTQFPDASHAVVDGKPAPEVVQDDAWLHDEFVPTVQKRGAAVLNARKASSAMSAAKAACDHMRSWWHGTPPGEWVSMAIFSDGSHYNAPEGIMFSFPVTINQNKEWSIVPGLEINDYARKMLDITGAELVSEKAEAMEILEA